MNTANLIAKAEAQIQGAAAEVWDALVNPEKIKAYMFGATTESDWKVNSEITWKGEFKGKAFVDKGKILEIKPEKVLKYSHFSPLSGQEDKPENYHTVTIELKEKGNQTHVVLSQDNNPTKEAQQHSEENWRTMLEGIKKVVEKQ